MFYTIFVKPLAIQIPTSKSITNRVFVLACMAKEPIEIQYPLDCDDTCHMVQALRAFGAKIQKNGNVFTITPPKHLDIGDHNDIDVGEAGTVARFVSAMSLVLSGRFRLFGGPSISSRPQGDLFQALQELGVGVYPEKKAGHLPTTFEGKGGYPNENQITLSGNVSSQFITALLLVAPRLNEGLTLTMPDRPPSQSYIDMTLALLDLWGVKTSLSENKKTITLKKGITNPSTYQVPADMSAASYPLAWSMLSKTPLTITNFGTETLQGDEGFRNVLQTMGAQIDQKGGALTLIPPKTIQPFESLDFSGMQDVSMTAMILAVVADGTSTLTGLENLKVKECDRVKAMYEGLQQLGVRIETDGDTMTIEGGRYWGKKNNRSLTIDSYDDHRIAMCFGVIQSALNLDFDISNPPCVAKTWPNFWKELAEWEGLLRPVSATIVWREGKNGKKEYLLVQKPRKANAWQFPQGGVDRGENPLKGAARELLEECGKALHVKYLGGRPIGEYKYLFPEDFQRWQKTYGTEGKVWKGACVSFYEAVYIEGEVMVDGVELVDHKWLGASEIERYVTKEYWKHVKGVLTSR